MGVPGLDVPSEALLDCFPRKDREEPAPRRHGAAQGGPIRQEAQVPQAREWLRAHELFKTRGGTGSRLRTPQIPNQYTLD